MRWTLRVSGKPKAGYTIHWNRNRVDEAQKQPQCTCQAKTVVGGSLTTCATLLVLPTPCSGPS